MRVTEKTTCSKKTKVNKQHYIYHHINFDSQAKLDGPSFMNPSKSCWRSWLFYSAKQELKCPGLWAAHTVQVCCQINSNSDQNEVITRLRKKITFRIRIIFCSRALKEGDFNWAAQVGKKNPLDENNNFLEKGLSINCKFYGIIKIVIMNQFLLNHVLWKKQFLVKVNKIE